MIPILYEKTETAFASNGLGRLSSCIRCHVTEERNGIFECEFEFPVADPMFEQIQEGRIIACTHDEQGDIQPFDIYGRSEPINGVVTFYAHHISYRLNEITVRPFTAGSCSEALSKIKSQSINANPFTFWTNKSVTSSFVSDVPKNAKGMLAGEQGSILDIYGTGEYEFDKFDVKLYQHRGQDTNVSIRYGKNLVDFTNDYDVSESYTAVVPYWLGDESEGEQTVSTLVMLPELFISSGHSVPSGREVVVPMDLSDVFDEPPSVTALRSIATNRLTSSNAWDPNQTVSIDFVQLWQTEEYKDYAPLQRLRLCDTCGVFVPMYDMALRAKVIRVVYNVLLDRYDEMELGDKPTTYTAVIEKMYDSKVAGVVAGLQSLAVDISTVQTIAANDATSKANAAEQNAKNYADSGLSALQSGLEEQIDAKIETWAQVSDPQTSWTDKSVHTGDLWLYTGLTDTIAGNCEIRPQGVYEFTFVPGGNLMNQDSVDLTNENNVILETNDSGVWSPYASTSDNLFDLADGKSTIYYGSPTDSYPDVDSGDYLVDRETGMTYRYQGGAWVKQTDYQTYTNNEVAALKTELETQIDAKIETWAQSTNPATSWTTTDVRAQHNGDLWLYTGTSNLTVGSVTIKPQGVYKYNGSNDTWSAYSSTSNNLFDLVDGKSTIFYGSTSGTYANKEVGDYLVDPSTGNTYRWSGSAWVKQTDYNSAIAAAKQTIEQQYEQAIDDATELIRGGTGGYVVTTVNANGQPIELLITDNMDLNQAINVWRWNQGGLAHSHTGYNGPFNDVAITADGKINASRILTGALTANLITAGTISSVDGLNTWNLESGQLVAKKGSIGGYTITSSTIEHLSGSSNQNYTRLNADGLSLKYSGSSGVYTYRLYTGQDGLRIQFQPTNRGNVDAPQIAPNYIKNDRNNLYYAEATISSLNAIRLGGYSKNIRGQNPLTVFVTEPAFIGGDSATPVSESVLIQDGLYVLGTLEVNGTKNRVVKTDNYSHRLLYCYETPTPLFGDIGEAQIDADGFCYIDLDDIFTETIAEQVEYQVFLQKEGEGDCWVADKQQRFFVIQGTPNLKVAWELKAKQKDYHNLRLEQSGRYLDEYERIEDDFISLDNYINEQEELLYG